MYEEVSYPEAPFSLTVKDQRGDLLTVRGIDVESFLANASALFGRETVDAKLSNYRASLGAQPAAAAQPANPAPAPQMAAQGSAPAGSGDWRDQAPSCRHGQRRPQEWVAKSGRNAGQTQYTYFCPQPREATDKCKPLDAISGKEWG